MLFSSCSCLSISPILLDLTAFFAFILDKFGISSVQFHHACHEQRHEITLLKINETFKYIFLLVYLLITLLLSLAKSDWILEPPSLFEDQPLKMQPSTDEFQESGSCVFVDRSGFYNLAFMLPVHVFLRVCE